MSTEGPVAAAQAALEEIEKHTFTARQKGMIEGMMASWDDRDELTEGEEKALFAEFGTNYALGGALYALIKTTEDNAANKDNNASDKIDETIKQMIIESMDKWKIEEPRSSASFRRS